MQGITTAPDLVERDFNPEAPDRLWSADITYIWTLEGWLFLSHVEDLFSRRIVGWEMADHMRKELVISALEMAVRQRKPDAGCIHHSDKGSQFTAVLFGERCARAGNRTEDVDLDDGSTMIGSGVPAVRDACR